MIERYQGRLLAFARARLRQPGEAEDALQETLLGFMDVVEKAGCAFPFPTRTVHLFEEKASSKEARKG